MKSLYIAVAGFVIQNTFHRTEATFSQRWFYEYIQKYYAHHIVKPTTPHIVLNWVPDVEHVTRRGNDYYVRFYRTRSAVQYECFYHISPYYYELIVREALYSLLIKDGGLLFHASASLVKNKAHIFLGLSGQGKSTLMKLLHPHYPALADDSVIIKKEGNEYYMYQTPFIEKESWLVKHPQKYKIGTLYFIEQGNRCVSAPLATRGFATHLLKHTYAHTSHSRKIMKNIIGFIDKNPNGYSLIFPKNSRKVLSFFTEL